MGERTNHTVTRGVLLGVAFYAGGWALALSSLFVLILGDVWNLVHEHDSKRTDEAQR
jgi:hypothetical protein